MKRDVAIVGAGYVGLPLARTFADAGTSVLLVDVDPARVAQLNAGESYIEDVPTEVLRPLVERGLVAATTDYDELREADAILVALPTPLSRQREPDLRILVVGRGRDRDAAPDRTSRRPRVDDLSGDDPRAGAAPPRARERAHRGEGLPPRVLPGARRPGTRGLDDEERAEGRRRDRRGLDGRCGRPLREGDRRRAPRLVARGGRADEAAREHLPVREHRARQRARATLRPHGHRRLGGRGRGRDEAVRLHVVQAGTGARRALHPGRPLLPHLEGARVRLLHRVHRARREGERVDAVLLQVRRLAGAEPQAAAIAQRLARSSCSGSRTSPTSRTRANRPP